MTDNQLIRVLLWQNGLLRGLLKSSLVVLTTPIDCEEADKLVEAANSLLVAPLPSFLVDSEQPPTAVKSC